MKKRIFFGMCLVAFVAVLITSLFTVVAVFGDNRQTLKKQIVVEADYVKTAYESLGVPYLDGLNKSIGGRLTVIDTDGTVLYDSVADVGSLENHGDREEVRAALEKGSGGATRFSDTIDEQTYYYAVRMSDGRVIRVANTVSTLYSAILSLVPWIIAIVILAVLIAAFLANFVTRRIVNPINAINLDAPEENEVYEEFSPLLLRMEKQRRQIKEQMSTLNQKQREFAAITENMQEGLIVVDRRGDVLSHNRGALQLCGYGAAFSQGQSVFVMNRDIEFCRAVEEALKGKSTEHRQLIGGRHCRFFLSPVKDGASGAVIVIMDVTEKENREELRREFTANVSHELKTPLTSISGYAEIIKNGIAKEKDIPGFADKIYTEAGRLIALVSDIIKLSRLDESDGALKRRPCDLSKIADSAIRRLECPAAAAKVQLELSGECTMVNGVSSMLEEMVYNLCDNAIKYNRPGGSVRVSVSREDGRALISVQDTGIGIPEDDRSRIFERFYRVDKSHSKETGGTGLGLSIVKHCVQLHGGEIQLESTLDVGTTVRVRL